ncbi:MAG: PAS domain S-box protein [Deltaproteobacteria bacterium]|nr:PAS domain S-box protein [Deltaproteobacteria bacterium]
MSERRFRQLITLAPIPLCYVTHNGVIEYFNNRFNEVFGYTHDEIPKLSEWRLHAYPDEKYRQWVIATWIEAVKKASDKGCDIEPVEHNVTCKNGTVRNVIIGGILIGDNFLATFFDITDRRKAEDALRASEEMHRSILRASPDSITITDLSGTILMVSPATLSTFGFSTETDAVGHLFTDFLVTDDRERAKGNISLMLREEIVGMADYRALHSNGSSFDIETNADFILDETGRPARIIFMVRDITERKRAEVALRQANKQINLLSSITRHDILNQLMALKGYLELSHDVIDKPEILSGYIKREQQAANAIEQQITFTKDYQELGVVNPRWQNVNASIQKAVGMVPIKQIRVEVDRTDLEIYADPLFEKVFYNLIDNALRYGGDQMKTIRISSHESDGHLTLVCEDDGLGIAAEDKKRLFSRGFGKNTGLGLFLSREILSITGITIQENGIPGKGARFEIVVPKTAFRMRE